MTVILAVVFLVCLMIGMPVAFALGMGTLAALVTAGYDPLIFFHRMVNSISSFSLIAVPLYIFAGNLCGSTGITKRLVRFCTAFVGHIPGGSGLVNVLASVFFGGVSGSAVADTSAIGGMMIPAMEEEGYDTGFAAGITIASSTIGILIPPSIPLCLYGICAEVSIGALFLAGIVPGLAVAWMQMLLCTAISRRRGYPKKSKAGISERWAAVKDAAWALGMPLIILVGCGFGMVTASEAGVLAVLYSLFVGFFIYRELKPKDLPVLMKKSVVTSAVALYIVGVASVVAWVINVDQIPAKIIQFLHTSVSNTLLILICINLLLFLVGCFMDLVPAMLLFAPVFLPVVVQLGISPVQFGVIMTINLGIGLLTPPVGNCLFVAAGITGKSTFELFLSALPFILCNVACLLLVHLFPVLTLGLPLLFGQ